MRDETRQAKTCFLPPEYDSHAKTELRFEVPPGGATDVNFDL